MKTINEARDVKLKLQGRLMDLLTKLTPRLAFREAIRDGDTKKLAFIRADAECRAWRPAQVEKEVFDLMAEHDLLQEEWDKTVPQAEAVDRQELNRLTKEIKDKKADPATVRFIRSWVEAAVALADNHTACAEASSLVGGYGTTLQPFYAVSAFALDSQSQLALVVKQAKDLGILTGSEAWLKPLKQLGAS